MIIWESMGQFEFERNTYDFQNLTESMRRICGGDSSRGQVEVGPVWRRQL